MQFANAAEHVLNAAKGVVFGYWNYRFLGIDYRIGSGRLDLYASDCHLEDHLRCCLDDVNKNPAEDENPRKGYRKTCDSEQVNSEL